MDETKLALLVAGVLLTSCGGESSERALREALKNQSVGVLELPPGDLVISEPLRVNPATEGLEIRGVEGSRIVASKDFTGPALLVIERVKDVTLRDFAIDGNRGRLAKPFDMAPPENAFRVWYSLNGILADQIDGLRIERVDVRNVVHFPILVSRSAGVRIAEVTVEDSGGLNAKGRNNLSGGILIEEGSANFEVRGSKFHNVRGNALWTHSLFTSPQLLDGAFLDNQFEMIGRDAIQVGHGRRVRVEGNTGRSIGYPLETVDAENGGTPVALDTAGDVDGARYVNNRFEEINGKCMDLDGFHNGLVSGNSCTNRKPLSDYPHGHFGIVMNNSNPSTHSNNIEISRNTIDGAKYGGLFLIGSNNRILDNRFLNVNLAHCNESSPSCIYKADEPAMLESGIYLSSGGARAEEARDNIVRGNTVTGYRMSTRCFGAAPTVQMSANTAKNNICKDADVR